MGFGARCSGHSCRLRRGMLWRLTCSTARGDRQGGGLGLAAVPAAQTGDHRMGLIFRIWECDSLKKLIHNINLEQVSCLGDSCVGRSWGVVIYGWSQCRNQSSASAVGCFSPDRAISLLFLFLSLFQGCSNKSSDLSTFQPTAPVAGIALLTEIHRWMETKFCVNVRFLYLDLKNLTSPCFFNHDTKIQWLSEAFEFQNISSHPAQLRSNRNTAVIS